MVTVVIKEVVPPRVGDGIRGGGTDSTDHGVDLGGGGAPEALRALARVVGGISTTALHVAGVTS